MKHLAISISMSLNKIGVTEIGPYSWQLWGFTTLAAGVMELVFHWEGAMESCIDKLKR